MEERYKLLKSHKDRISDLPECIIHHIMSFLPALDVIKIRLLSKKFFMMWISFPIVVFDLKWFATTNLFLNYVEQVLKVRKLNGDYSSLEKLVFNASILGFEWDSRVDEMLNYAMRNNVRDLSLDIDSNFNNNILLQNPNPYCFREDHAIFSAKSITSLNLKGFDFNPQDISLDFSSAANFSLINCGGFRSIKLCGSKLRRVEIDSCFGLEKVQIDAPNNIESFSYGGQWINCELNLSQCKSLKFFELRNEDISKEWIESNFSWLNYLEKLTLIGCFFLYKINDLYFVNLKSLEVILCDCNAEFRAPNLVWFKYRGCLLMKTPSVYSNDRLDVDLNFDSHDKTDLYLQRMRDFIRAFSYCQNLSLHCVYAKDIIYSKETREILDPPICNIKHLKIVLQNKVRSLVELVHLVESLLWLAPHPNTISITANNSQVEKCIKFDYEKPVVEFVCQHCQPIRCWLHNLKKVILKNFEDDEYTILYTYLSSYLLSHRSSFGCSNDKALYAYSEQYMFEASTGKQRFGKDHKSCKTWI